MVKTRRAIHFQLGGLVAAIVLLLLLSRFFPIVDLVEAVQQRVVRWGVNGAVCYHFLFAGCNILLLRTLVGFLHRVHRKRDWRGNFFCAEPMAGRPLV
jgi:hypothetical protein